LDALHIALVGYGWGAGWATGGQQECNTGTELALRLIETVRLNGDRDRTLKALYDLTGSVRAAVLKVLPA
jgi:hypothetical protein